MRRTHQISRSRSGTGGMRGANAKLSPPASSARLHARDEHEHDEEQHELHEPGRVREVEREHLVERSPTTIAPTTACGNDVMPPMSAAVRPSSSVSGPIEHELGRAPASVA